MKGDKAIEEVLLDRALDVCEHLLPDGKQSGTNYTCGSIDGEPGKSLSIDLRTGRWKDFATEDKGSNLLKLWSACQKIQSAEAIVEIREFLNLPPNAVFARRRKTDSWVDVRKTWPTLETGSPANLRLVSAIRKIPVEGLELAMQRGLLCFATWKRQPCWFITDRRRYNAQARRIDGEPFIINKQEIKAQTLPGSKAGLPVGIFEAGEFSTLLITEGGPDALAAHALITLTGRENDCAVVAMLGASHRPSFKEWGDLSGKRIRIYAHADDAGMKAAFAWGKEMYQAGACHIDGFRFEKFHKENGTPVEDLNDLLALPPEVLKQQINIKELLP